MSEIYRGPPDDDLSEYGGWPPGWSKTIVMRQGTDTKTKGTKDRYWYSPSGKKYRSMVQVKKALSESKPESTATSAESAKIAPAAVVSSSTESTVSSESAKNGTSKGRRRRSRAPVFYGEDADSGDTEGEEAPTRPRKKARKSNAAAMDVDPDDMELDNQAKKDAKKGKKSNTAKKATPPKKEGKSMAESFKPFDTPLFWDLSLDAIKKRHEYLDPCGMEATDDVIDHLVGEQVLKIGNLLQKALLQDPRGTLGGSNNPLNLGTACSGTDAPALALTMVQEQMERFQFDAKLHYNHQFSCEKEPFKQSYLARNFDSVLYPDIVKLTDEEPRDVYGRIKPIPKHNVFVAGTSCKNFSLLQSTKRMDIEGTYGEFEFGRFGWLCRHYCSGNMMLKTVLDIEDKGCSGETFLAAVELLMQEQPDFTIFENVIGAPWAKMQEYVTGRVALKTVDSKAKAIQSIVAKDNKIKELTFQLQDDNQSSIMAIEIPLQVGVRCGAVVKGFLLKESDRLIRAQWPAGKKRRTCTLTDLLKANPQVDSEQDTLVFESPCTYCTCIQKVDTKNYGLPQTRNRTYMFVWKAEKLDDYNDDLGVYWQALVKFLESPVKHSLDAFILNTDHDKIRVFREALHGPPGRHTKRAVYQEPDFFTSGNANVKHNVVARDKLGMGRLLRKTTESGARGKKQIPPHYWLEYIDCCTQRQLDMLDILHASAARDAETHDSYFSSFFWNISQNVSKEKHRMKVPGIAGCISPGGEFLVTNLGRPLLGCEKLLLQGIPYFRLTLGNETEVQLGDLAGNAMSLTVVCATLLAAIGCRQLRKDNPGKKLDSLLGILEKTARMEHASQGVVIPKSIPDFGQTSDASSTFQILANLAPEAVQSSVWCTCETSGRNSDSTHFLCCSLCRISCCASCMGSHKGYQMKSHNIKDVKLSPEEHNLGTFLSKLRNKAPSSLVFDEEGISFLASFQNDVHRVADLHKFSFNLQKIQRLRRKWVLYYNARDNNGVGEVVASFVVTIGELSTQAQGEAHSPTLGMKGELISYLPAKTTPLVSGLMEPCAIVTVKQGTQQSEWHALMASANVTLAITGENPKPSIRVELGLSDKTAKSLQKAAFEGSQSKHFAKSKERGEERRWIYPSNWKEWPATLNILSPDYLAVNGVYKRAPCRQTVNQSALWIRDEKEKPPLYVIIKPNVGRTGPDYGVISSSISADDFSDVLVTLPPIWQPCDALLNEHPKLSAQKTIWISASQIMCSVPASTIEVVSESVPPSFISLRGLSEAQVNMIYPFESNENEIKLKVHGGVESQKIVRSFNYLCAPPILRHAARSETLSHELSPNAEWETLVQKSGAPRFGFCDHTIPARPVEKWVYNEERDTWMRVSSPEDSREYYRKLQEAKMSFDFVLDRKQRSLAIRCYPEVAAHHAARFLLGGRGISENAQVAYRLSDISLQTDPSYAPFKVFPCKAEVPTDVGLKAPYKLYERQQKVVTKMSMIESGRVSYEEIEMAEHYLPGSTGFSLIAKASRNRNISGGVIADAIGAGKTVISIALILQGLDQARKSRSFPRKSGASLVVVPCGLIKQWESEIEKFTSGMNVILIHDTKKLKKTTVTDIIEADVVIAPVDILESEGYTDVLSRFSGGSYNIPELPSKMGQVEKAGVSGVWIPATSRDPYGLGTATEMKNQRNRELSAFFTYSYQASIEKLRQKEIKPSDFGVPLEFFEWERVIVDEIHECLMSEKDFLELAWFKEKNRRASRELLGIAQKDVRKRPLAYRQAIYGLTATPLLDNSNRVIELANLIGCTYIVGLAGHWRKFERESRRDIFLQQFLEPTQSREIRKAIYSKSQEYLRTACCRNTTEKELEGIQKVETTVSFKMTTEEEEAYIASQHGLERNIRGLGIRPENFDPTAGHDISKFLKQNADTPSRGKALVETCKKILGKDPATKIIVFADGRIGAGHMARDYLNEDGLGCTCLEGDVELQNETISFYQRADATDEDRARPRVLVLHFEHAAGLNLQSECYNLVLYSPLYVGDGGITGDPVSDASTEQQAIGRVYRPGQVRPQVFVYRLELQGPQGEECVDGYLIRRTTDKETLDATTNAAEEEDKNKMN